MRILFICKRYYTNKDLLKDHFGRLYHLPLELARRGAIIEVVAIDYRNEIIEEIDVTELNYRSIPATLTKILFLPYLLYRIARNAKPDVVVASGDSHIGFIAMLIAKILGVRFVFDIYDYYPVFGGNNIPGMKVMFRLSVKLADLVLCASESLLNKLLPLNAKSLLIENGVDRDVFAPSDMAQARIGLGIDSDLLLVGYFGSIDHARGPLLIQACEILHEEFPKLHLLLAGHLTGVLINAPWITYLGEVPQAALPQMINACNIVAIPYANTPFNNMSGACKIAEYLACEKPIVVTRVSAHEQIFKAAPCSLCEPTSQSLADALRRQVAKPEVVPFPVELNWQSIGSKLYQSLQFVSGSASKKIT